MLMWHSRIGCLFPTIYVHTSMNIIGYQITLFRILDYRRLKVDKKIRKG